MLGEPDDRRPRRRLEVGQRREVAVLRLLAIGIDGPAVRAAVGEAELLLDPLDHVVGEGVAELVCVDVRFRRGVAHEVRQEALDDSVLADDPLGPLAAGLGQERLLLLAPLDQPLRLEAPQHLAGRGARHAEHLGDPGGQGRRAGRERPILADRKGEEVDRFQVLVDGMTLRHLAVHSSRRPSVR